MATGEGEMDTGEAKRGREMISESVQDYLKAIYKLSNSRDTDDGVVSTSLLAERMGVSAASATNMIKKLAEIRLAKHMPYQGVELTEAGEKISLEIIRHHRLLELYLSETLGFAWDQVDAEADRLEHAISEDFEDRIDRALGNPQVGAHGEPIPSKDGDIEFPKYLRLSELSEGDRAWVREVSDRDPEMLRYLHQQGLVLGARVEVQEKAPFRGPMMLTIGSDAAKHIGMEVAASVFVDLDRSEGPAT
jgi:DtxR family Mn-dependent transcriptional regulator